MNLREANTERNKLSEGIVRAAGHMSHHGWFQEEGYHDVQVVQQKALQFSWKGFAGAVDEPLLLFQRSCQHVPWVSLCLGSISMVGEFRKSSVSLKKWFVWDYVFMDKLVTWSNSRKLMRSAAASWT